MTLDQMKIARSRLRLGIANVGFWVLVACAGLYWLAGRGSKPIDAQRCVLIGAAAVVAQGMFDFMGGVRLMPQVQPAVKDFLRRWISGALGHILILAGVGLLSYARFVLSSGIALAILVSSFALALVRINLLRLHALEHAPAGFIPGNLARSNLYYSWATLTPLGRAVHCNVGHPARWVFPPSA